MALVTDLRKSVTESTPVLAVVGATDLAVKRVRAVVANASELQAGVEARVAKIQAGAVEVQHRVEKAVADFDAHAVQARITEALAPEKLQASAKQVPALAVAKALEASSKVEASYEQLAARGSVLVERVRSQKATQDLLAQGKTTISRTKAAVTTARKAVDETATAALGVVAVGRREAGEVVADVEQKVVDVEVAAEKAATTATTRAAATRGAAKGAVTSARKTASKAAKAAGATAEKIGE